MHDEEEELEEHDGPVCPSCISPVEPEFDYCPACEAPLSQFATTDPLKAIRSEGEMFRRGANAPSLIVVIGMWLIFLPGLLFSAMTLREAIPQRHGFSGPLLMVLLCAAILYKVTSRYLQARSAAETD